MSGAAIMDLIGAGGVCVAMVGLLNWRLGSIHLASCVFLALALVAYLFVTFGNALEHLGVSDALDFYEDFAEVLFFILAVLFLRRFQ